MGFHIRRRSLAQALRRLSLFGTTLLLLCVALNAWGQSGTTETEEEMDKRSMIIGRTTMSPFCPGRTLDSCPSPNATQWRRDIREMVAKGMTTEEIRVAMAARSEADISGEPSTVLDSVLPAAVTGIALVLLVLLLRTLVRARAASSAKEQPKKATSDDRALDARLDAELKKLDEGGLDEKVD